MSEIIRICKIHGELKEKDIRFRNKITPKGTNIVTKECRHCAKRKGVAWLEKNKDKFNEYRKNRIILNIESERARRRKQYAKNPKKWRDVAKKNAINLENHYVKNLLVGKNKNLRGIDFPTEIIDLKKIVVLIKREINKITNGDNK